MTCRRWWTVGAAAALSVLAGCGGASPRAVPTTVAVPTTAPLPATTTTSPAPATTAPGAAGPDVVAASFLDTERGWALTEPVTCGPTLCGPQVEATEDGGVTWSTRSRELNVGTAPGAVDGLAFAGALDGYAYGHALELTTDGGTTWRSIPVLAGIAPFDVSDLVATPQAVVAVARAAGLTGSSAGATGVTGPYLVVEATPGSALFHLVGQLPGGAGAGVQLVAAGVGVLAVQGSTVDAVGAGLTVAGELPAADCLVAAGSGSQLVTVCGGGATASGSRTVWSSRDGGRHWETPTRPGEGAGGTTTGVGARGAAIAVATAGPSSASLLVTADGGRTWHDALTLPGVRLGTPRFDGPEVATVVARPSSGDHGALYRSTDGGRTWRPVGL